MRHETVERLPSLAHPLIFNPFEEETNHEEFLPLQRLPFPEIDPTWEGFEFSHLRWVGLKEADIFESGKLSFNQARWRTELTGSHEWCHLRLSSTPFSQYRKGAHITFNMLIAKTFIEGKTGIPVPLDDKQSRNELEKYWEIIVRIHTVSELVQEVFAVRSSLINTPGEGRVSHDFQKRFLEKYKVVYESYMYGFTAAYDVFDSIAGQIGEVAATAMIHNVFKTINPDVAFSMILLYLMNQSEDRLRFISTLSSEEADHYFTSITSASDPDDSTFSRRRLQEDQPLIDQMINDKPQMLKEGLLLFALGSEDTTLWSSYRDSMIILPFVVYVLGGNSCYKGTQEDLYGISFLLIEAIRQQLTTGIGLVCSFSHLSRSCCGERNREFLEKVWARTCPTSKCLLWQRQGCLQ